MLKSIFKIEVLDFPYPEKLNPKQNSSVKVKSFINLVKIFPS